MARAPRWSSRTTSSISSAPTSCCRSYIDRPIAVEQVRGQATETFTGTLLSTQGGLVLRRDDGTRAGRAAQRRRQAAGAARRTDHASDAGLGRRRAARRHAPDARLVPDAGHDLVGGLQRHLRRRRERATAAAWTSAPGSASSTSPGAGYADAKLKLVAGDVHRATAVGAAKAPAVARARRCAATRKVRRLRREGVLRVSPVHAGPHHHPARQLDQADRTVPGGAARAVRKDAGLLRRAGRRTRLPAVAGHRPQLRRAEQPQGRRLPAVQQRRRQRHGHAAAGRPRARVASSTRRPDARVHRRGRDRPHAAQREGAAQARLRVRRRRRAAASWTSASTPRARP